MHSGGSLRPGGRGRPQGWLLPGCGVGMTSPSAVEGLKFVFILNTSPAFPRDLSFEARRQGQRLADGTGGPHPCGQVPVPLGCALPSGFKQRAPLKQRLQGGSGKAVTHRSAHRSVAARPRKNTGSEQGGQGGGGTGGNLSHAFLALPADLQGVCVFKGCFMDMREEGGERQAWM